MSVLYYAFPTLLPGSAKKICLFVVRMYAITESRVHTCKRFYRGLSA